MSVRQTASLMKTVAGSARQAARAAELGKRLEGKNRSLSYAEWLGRNGTVGDSDALRNALTKRAKNSPDYGAAAQKLSDLGLDKTGYANYLRRENEAAYQRSEAEIREQNAARESGNRNGYLAYLKRWESEQDELMQKTLSSLAESKVSNLDDAYADALAAGLTDERARIVSRLAPTVGEYGMRRLREGISGVLAVSLSAGLSGAEAEVLARACGISQADAKKLRQTVESSPTGGTVGGADRFE